MPELAAKDSGSGFGTSLSSPPEPLAFLKADRHPNQDSRQVAAERWESFSSAGAPYLWF